MNILNKNIAIILLICFCVLSINRVVYSKDVKSIYAKSDINALVKFESVVTNTTDAEKTNGSIKFTFPDLINHVNLLLITNSKTGTKNYKCSSKDFLITSLSVGSYVILMTDDSGNTNKIQFEIK